MLKREESPPCVTELYARAVNSSSLSETNNHTARLAAMASSRNLRDDDAPEQREKKITAANLGSELFRVKYAGDVSSMGSLAEAWRGKIAKLAKGRNWEKSARHIADESLKYWLSDTCEVCHGRAAPKIENTPILSDLICPACGGSGKRPVCAENSIKNHVLNAIQFLNHLEREAGGLAIKKLSDSVRML